MEETPYNNIESKMKAKFRRKEPQLKTEIINKSFLYYKEKEPVRKMRLLCLGNTGWTHSCGDEWIQILFIVLGSNEIPSCNEGELIEIIAKKGIRLKRYHGIMLSRLLPHTIYSITDFNIRFYPPISPFTSMRPPSALLPSLVDPSQCYLKVPHSAIPLNKYNVYLSLEFNNIQARKRYPRVESVETLAVGVYRMSAPFVGTAIYIVLKRDYEYQWIDPGILHLMDLLDESGRKVRVGVDERDLYTLGSMKLMMEGVQKGQVVLLSYAHVIKESLEEKVVVVGCNGNFTSEVDMYGVDKEYKVRKVLKKKYSIFLENDNQKDIMFKPIHFVKEIVKRQKFEGLWMEKSGKGTNKQEKELMKVYRLIGYITYVHVYVYRLCVCRNKVERLQKCKSCCTFEFNEYSNHLEKKKVNYKVSIKFSDSTGSITMKINDSLVEKLFGDQFMKDCDSLIDNSLVSHTEMNAKFLKLVQYRPYSITCAQGCFNLFDTHPLEAIKMNPVNNSNVIPTSKLIMENLKELIKIPKIAHSKI